MAEEGPTLGSGPEGYLDRKFEEAEDIGGGVRIRRFVVSDPGDDTSTIDAGIFVMHRHDDGHLCIGTVMFDIPATAHHQRNKWTVESADPLTLSPSILRTVCGLHGYVRAGRWAAC